MSKKRGVSLEEKRERILQIFYDSQDFYLLKELEKLGPKKGVISQSVKDVLQSLVDDDLVLKDKVGSSIYFWSLPSCAGIQLRNAYCKLEADLVSSKKRLAELIEQRDSLKEGREESDEREVALVELKAIEQKHNELKEEMGLYADNDPAALEAMKNAIEVAHSAANRWTDNIFILQQWCSNNFPQAKEHLEHLYKEVILFTYNTKSSSHLKPKSSNTSRYTMTPWWISLHYADREYYTRPQYYSTRTSFQTFSKSRSHKNENKEKNLFNSRT